MLSQEQNSKWKWEEKFLDYSNLGSHAGGDMKLCLQTEKQELRRLRSRNLDRKLILCFVSIICVLAHIVFMTGKCSSRKINSVCMLPACIHASSEILYNLHSNYSGIDPCTNFEQFVCGGWQDRHDIRSDQGEIFVGTVMSENSQRLLRHILEDATLSELSNGNSAVDEANFAKIKDAYDACMDEEKIKKSGSGPLLDVLNKMEDLYHPNTTQINEALRIASPHNTPQTVLGNYDKNLTKAILFLLDIGVEALLSFGISADDRDPDSIVIFITPPRQIGLPSREYYNNTNTVADYARVMREVLADFRKNHSDLESVSNRQLIEQIATGVLDFETKLAEISPDTQAQEDVTQYYNPFTLSEAQQLVPQISLGHIISSLSSPMFTPNRLIVGSPSYTKSLSKILVETPTETVLEFLKWKVIQTYASGIEDSSVTALRQFNNRLQGKDPDVAEERWRKCIRVVDEGLGWILSQFFVRKAFSQESKQFGDQIVSDIKDQFINTLGKTEWMTKEVRELGIQKVRNIVQKIGYPTKSPNVLDPVDLQRYYSDLSISNTTFFANMIEMAKFDTARAWLKLGKPTDRNEWDMTVPTVNAYYNPPGNEIVFPAGIMQAPIFHHPSIPQYLTYGSFGAISGHELSHAFDSTGRHYDETGNYTNWWDDKTVDAFEQRAKCFVDQYSKFTVPGLEPDSKPLHVNGRLTLGENIADAGGLKAAFKAWQKREAASPGATLPGLDVFSKEQLFFVSYSTFWCSKTRKESAIRRLYGDPHAPKPARILGTLANSREFRAAFNCPIKEPTCELW